MADSFAFYITVLRKQFTAYCFEKLSKMGVTYGQLFILIFVGKRGKCSPKEISLALKLDAGHLNRTLSKLVQNEFLLHQKNEKDKRANVISLAAKGREVFKKSHELFEEWDEAALSPLTDCEKQSLMELLKKLTSFQMEGSANEQPVTGKMEERICQT